MHCPTPGLGPLQPMPPSASHAIPFLSPVTQEVPGPPLSSHSLVKQMWSWGRQRPALVSCSQTLHSIPWGTKRSWLSPCPCAVLGTGFPHGKYCPGKTGPGHTQLDVLKSFVIYFVLKNRLPSWGHGSVVEFLPGVGEALGFTPALQINKQPV